MIKFFRRTRQKLLAEKRVGRYLAYALGEIVLVVIGILIALAINNRNQRNIDAKNEQTYLLGLQEEFNISKNKLTELIAVNRANIESAEKIIGLMNQKDSLPLEEDLSQLLLNTFISDVAFNPNNSLLLEIINSGNLKNISNPDLRIMLTSWIATMEDISRQEEDLRHERENLLDIFRTDRYSIKTVLKQTGVLTSLKTPPDGEKVSNIGVLFSQEFENKLLLFIVTCHATEDNHYSPLMGYIDGILESISSEIQDK